MTGRRYLTASTVFSVPFLTSWPTTLAPFSVLLAATLVAWPVLSAAFSVPFAVSLAASLVASPVLSAAFLVPFAVSLATTLVAWPVAFAALSVAWPVSLAAFLVSVATSCASASGNTLSKAAASIAFRIDFICPPRLCCQKLPASMRHRNSQRKRQSKSKRKSQRNHQSARPSRQRPRGVSSALAFQRAEGLVIHIPLLQDVEDGFHPESGPRQLPEDARCLLLILRLAQPLLAKKVASLLFVAHAVVCSFHRLLDHRPVHPARLQLRNHAHPPQLLVVAPQRREIGGILRIVQIPLILQPADHQFHQCLPIFRLRMLNPCPHQPFQFRDRAHAPCQRAHRIFIQLIFGISSSLGT